MKTYEPHGKLKPKAYKNMQKKIKRKELTSNTKENQQTARKVIKRRRKEQITIKTNKNQMSISLYLSAITLKCKWIKCFSQKTCGGPH